ncbi:exodeoxyribonuclease V subunit beta [Candidatus Parabeggiatoa sp. HSG14]|uniref:exodeoxyribonuclease V subunit beta n=1 Tax=Candidatus Parabeggiatoa sp. HSG14 TaxID=3055593 RepID=UPI0025A7F687|nr:exodeoxyribonuclease V subunit beta [Thiotrichales bacterium HSG14]
MKIQPTIEKLEPLSAPLQGINLIEASAGTGKTYTITTLFIRLILEKNLTVDKILVVTFTEAATEELRDRVRRRLREVLTAFELGNSDDEILEKLMQQYPDHEDAIFRLTNALRGFDEAAIFTIHSFCRQMLQDNAFESGVLFDTELVSDQSHLLREIVEDFWRQHFYETSQLFITYALENGYKNPSSLLKTLNYGQHVGQPFLKIIPQPESPLLEARELAFYTVFTETQQLWQSYATDIEGLLLNDKNLNRNKYRKTSIPQWCKAMSGFLTSTMSINLPDKFAKFTTTELTQCAKKGKTPSHHDFFDQCEKLLESQNALTEGFGQHLLALKTQLFEIAEQALTLKKHQHHILSFDDLLINLYKALIGKNGPSLAQLIRKKYYAALIDEFQDTDPVQYKIFSTVYGDGKHILFLIGDPKQAIYSFRGADIFTYMAACRDATHRYTLGTNWRSEADLIGGVNKLFESTTHPFLFEDISFQAVQAPDNNQHPIDKPCLKIENKQLTPLQLWFVSRDIAECSPDKPINKGWARQEIPYSVSHEIARLLSLGQQEQAMIGDKPLVAGDIAVLVRTNTQALQMQKVLAQLRIPSVLYSRESLFSSNEMMEIERILLAVADPSNEALIKAALTTDMIGISGNELHALVENDFLWQQRLNRFQHYHFLWQNVGFIQMYRALLLQEKVPTLILSYPDGERRLTNVLHAAEVLQQVAVQQKLGMSGLCQWLSQQRHSEGANAEEQQLRLESDEKRVKIVTIHKSKGLEYPIVFCPFVWDGYLHNSKAEQFTFHDEQDDLTLDLGDTEQAQHRKRALEEERAENLRLFYVAITRAKHRCYLIWGAFKDASTSALAHLIHPDVDVEKTEDSVLLQDLQTLANQSTNQIQISRLPTDRAHYQRPVEKGEQLKPRSFSRRIDKEWKVASFTYLSRHVSSVITNKIDQPDYDETTVVRPIVERETITPDSNHIFNFPRGARTGTFLHTLFEHLDFTQPDAEYLTIQLENHGYDVDKWQETIIQLIDDVLSTPLEPQQQDFTLSRITSDKRLNELEFYYPIPRITSKGLQAVFAESDQHVNTHFAEEIHRLEFVPVRGFMKGYIDMVFEYKGRYYLVDYKSNMLGTQQQAYHYDNLSTVMARENYLLQYHIYAVALHRYLINRLPNYHYENHFGGVFYLFLRGMNPHTGADFGIYRDLPKADLINRLSAYLGTFPQD